MRIVRPVEVLADDGGRADAAAAAGVPGLATERLTLRRLAESDRWAFLDAVDAGREHLSPWTPLNDPGESDDAFFDRQLAAAEAGDRDGTAWRRVGVDSDGVIVGAFHLNAITRGLEWQADASWWIRADRVRRGYAKEGIRAMLAHALGDLPAGLGLAAVHCGIDPANGASRACAEACGFRHCPGRRSYLRVGEEWAMHEFFMATRETVGAVGPPR